MTNGENMWNKIIGKCEAVVQSFYKSLELADYNHFDIDFSLSFTNRELDKIFFYDRDVYTPTGNRFLLQICYRSEGYIVYFGEQVQQDFALSEVAFQKIYELLALLNKYFLDEE